jgi:regulator of nucleoside diphosphate kinase
MGHPAQLTRPHVFREPTIYVLDEEYELLADLVCSSRKATPGIALLWHELDRAVIVSAGRAPTGLVHMNSLVRYTELDLRQPRTGRIVGARRPDAERAGLSVTSPVGAALIGLRVGDVFPWVTANGPPRLFRVDDVEVDTRRPERSKAARTVELRRTIDELLSRG